MIGLISCTNKTLLEEIRKRHPNGIWTKEDFVSKIEPLMMFYTVSAGESASAYEGDCYIFKSYTTKDKSRCKMTNGKIYFVKDFFWKPKGIFLDRDDMVRYVKDLNSHKNLWGMI